MEEQPLEPRVSITSVQFRNFKALKDFSVSLDQMNILVGPNNSGKSTIIGAFRALEAGLRTARARKPERVPARDGYVGYVIPKDSIPISLVNAQTDYQDVEASVTFRLSNSNRLVLSFVPEDENSFLYTEADNLVVNNTTAFKRAFPINIAVVPVLGPVENEEEVVREVTVRANLATHRASRNFRNYWRYNPEQFEPFRQTIVRTWPGMDITAPELLGDRSFLSMFCKENRIDRELFWTGFGFQVWCQLLTHIWRARDASMLVVDEPDIYLHPDLQRQLVSLLREAGPDILMATHSTDIIAEAEPTDILTVDKSKRSAKRIKGPEGISGALQSIGSVHNFALTQIERAGRVIFVEGGDYRILAQFARRLGLRELATGSGLVWFPLGGFPTRSHVRGVTEGIVRTVGKSLKFGGVFDRDFRSKEEVSAIQIELKDTLSAVMILERKEIENYLLVPTVLDRVLDRASMDRFRRTGSKKLVVESLSDIFDKLTRGGKADLQAQYIARRNQHLKESSKDQSTITLETIKMFEESWNDVTERMHIVAGKETYGATIAYIQNAYGLNLTASKIIEAFREDEIPWDLRNLLYGLESFRTAAL